MLQQLMKTVGSSHLPESWKRNWAYALDCLPEKEISFLTEEHVVRVRRWIRLTAPKVQLINEAIAVIREDANLRFLAWLWHCILFRKPDHADEKVASWPLPLQPAESPVSLPDLFPVVVLLSGYDQIEAIYEKVGNIPEQVKIDTLSKVNESMNMYKEKTGNYGLRLSNVDWYLYHFRGKLYGIGRLEFEMKAFGNHVRVFQKRDGEVIALSQPGIRYRRDGHVNGTNDIYDDEAWVADLVETGYEITGYPISSDGYAIHRSVTLNKSEWSLALTEGDDILNVHIPRKGAFTLESCRDAFSQAVSFFRTCFPDKRFPAFVCISWLMDPQLQSLVGETSNLVRFQKEFYPFPVLSGDKGLYTFVFRCDPCPVDDLPERTSLQRKIKEYMMAGGSMHNAGGFIFLPPDSRSS